MYTGNDQGVFFIGAMFNICIINDVVCIFLFIFYY